MTETNNTTSIPEPGDPRHSYALVTSAMRELMAGVGSGQLGSATPCPDFTVKELLEHVVMVQRRVAAIGSGEHWSSVQTAPADSGWLGQFEQASHAVMTAWTDSETLNGVYEVPWGEMPGLPLLWTYVAELSVHAWDLATATGQLIVIDDDALRPALEGVRIGVPADGRDHPEVPFSAVVHAGPNAAVLVQLAGWAGRPVAD